MYQILCGCVFSSLGLILRSGVAGSFTELFGEPPKCFLRCTHHFMFPPLVAEGSDGSTSYPHLLPNSSWKGTFLCILSNCLLLVSLIRLSFWRHLSQSREDRVSHPPRPAPVTVTFHTAVLFSVSLCSLMPSFLLVPGQV